MKVALLAAVAALSLGAASANAEDFTFSFQGDPSIGSLSGTVTGTISGLDPDGTGQRPTDVTATYNGVIYSYNPLGVFGSFTTTNGQITGAAYQTTLNGADVNLGLQGINQLIFGGDQVVINGGGFGGATYTPVSSSAVSAAPEPAAWALMMLGVGTIGVMLGSRKRVIVDHEMKLAAIG